MADTVLSPSLEALIANLQARIAMLERQRPAWAFGQGNITWPGGSAESDLITVATGLEPSTDARFAAIIPEGPGTGLVSPRRGLVGMVFDYNTTKPNLQGRLTSLDAALNPTGSNDYFWIVML